MVKVGRTKTRLHSDLAERGVDAKSHPDIYEVATELDTRIDGKITTHTAIAAAHHAKGISDVYIGTFTRIEAGDQVINGVGFQPKFIVFLAYGTGGVERSVSLGFDDGTVHHAIVGVGDSVDMVMDTDHSIFIRKDAENWICGYVSALGADGFTITWALTGTLAAYVTYSAMK